jgi:hypothetical protein
MKAKISHQDLQHASEVLRERGHLQSRRRRLRLIERGHKCIDAAGF